MSNASIENSISEEVQEIEIQMLLDLGELMSPNTRRDVRYTAFQQILQMSSDPRIPPKLLRIPKFLESLVSYIVGPNADPVFAQQSSLLLVNITGDLQVCDSFVRDPSLVKALINAVCDPHCKKADHLSMVLANLTRMPAPCREVWIHFESEDRFRNIFHVCCQTDFNKEGQHLDHLCSVLANLTQLPEARKCCLDAKLFRPILSFINFEPSAVRRQMVASVVKNLAMDEYNHDFLLSEDAEVFPPVLLSLAGPEELSDDENDMCATRAGREHMRSIGTYYVLRELHKTEPSAKVKLCCEDVIAILIRTEDEIGVDRLSSVELTPEIVAKFESLSTSTAAEGGSDNVETQLERPPIATTTPPQPPLSGYPRTPSPYQQSPYPTQPSSVPYPMSPTNPGTTATPYPLVPESKSNRSQLSATFERRLLTVCFDELSHDEAMAPGDYTPPQMASKEIGVPTKMRELRETRDKLIDMNRNIALANVNKEPVLTEMKALLVEKSGELRELFNEVSDMQKDIDGSSGVHSVEGIFSRLQEMANEAEEASDAFSERFLAKEIDLDEFVVEYPKMRKQAHLLRIKKDKMAELMSTLPSSVTSPPPPQHRAPYPADGTSYGMGQWQQF
ncbi:unnamed protein product [Cyprideis torosa]|uniref:Protein HGH1 homolog n=1 Tax=Cyprideis torosa TaxID=163714 RepID=A0A7R8W348_9CRUS|nr:unnamed protein product [Cyprideis torosa]CAG0882625.1 unnamed protein product [Cyprideis torosa]